MTASWYKAEWSPSVIISTVALLAILLAGIILTLYAAKTPNTGIRATGILTVAMLLSLIIVSYLLSPTGYLIDGTALTISRKIKPIVIPLAEISKTELSTRDLLSDSIRLLGNDGLWGCYGKYQNSRLGTYYLYIRGSKNLVLIESAKKYVIAPERPYEFLLDLNRAVARAGEKRSLK